MVFRNLENVAVAMDTWLLIFKDLIMPTGQFISYYTSRTFQGNTLAMSRFPHMYRQI